MGNPTTQEDGIADLGKKDAEIVSSIMLDEKISGLNIKSIYSSPFKRCVDTAKIINSKFNIPIIKETRFNEFNKETSIKDETWRHLSRLHIIYN